MQEGKMPFDLAKTFAAVGMVGEQPIAVAVNKDVPANNVAELVALANKTQGGMLFGATNRGGQAHLTGELFRDRSKANISFVHAAGAAATLNDVIAGRIPIVFEGLAGLQPGIQGGGVKLLGVAAPKRLPNLPNLPAINETVPGVVSSGWIVLMAPAGVPDNIIQKVNADLRKVVAMKEVQDRFHVLGTYTRDLTPAQTNEFMRSEEKLWWPIVRQVNQKQAGPAR
jgi:tripartite-type tricarboxylate transporter receptor subunit TctC